MFALSYFVSITAPCGGEDHRFLYQVKPVRIPLFHPLMCDLEKIVKLSLRLTFLIYEMGMKIAIT